MKKKCSEEKLEKMLADYTDDLIAESKGSRHLSSEDMGFPLEKKGEALSLFRTVNIISSVVHPKQTSEEFVDRVSESARKRFHEQVSTEKLQKIIGMAVTVGEFRKALFRDIVSACRGIGMSLTPREIAALRNLKEDSVKEFANSLDERITKFFPTNLP